jgi:DNA-binding HxlR family transcriptional regulator
VYPQGNPDAPYCLTDTGRRSIIIDVEMLRAWGATNKEIIEQYNKTIVKTP